MKVKKILLSLGLIGLGLISFTNGQFIEKGETIYISGGNSNTYVSILNGLTDIGNFYNKAIVSLWHNDYGNYSHQLFFHDNKIYFNHSLGNNSINSQGYITNWKICNLDENNYNNPNAVNCQGNYDTSINLDDINQVDSIYIDNWIINNINNASILCFIDKSQNKSFCVSCHYNNCPSGYTPGNLIDSNNYYNENAIFELGEDIFNGGGNGTNIETETGQEICTKIQDKIYLYGNKYTTSLCRSDGTTTSGGEIIQTGYVNIFTAYPTYQDYENSYKIYQDYCNKNSPRYDYTDCKNQLQGLPYGKAGATITRNGIESQLPIVKIYQYCRYQTHFTQEQKNGSGTCEFTEEEIYAPGITGELKNKANGSLIDLVKDSIEQNTDAEYISPRDGTIFDDILPDGIISWKELISIDFVGNLTKIIAKILVLFQTRPVVDGILPPIILSLLLLIVLFKMYKR